MRPGEAESQSGDKRSCGEGTGVGPCGGGEGGGAESLIGLLNLSLLEPESLIGLPDLSEGL